MATRYFCDRDNTEISTGDPYFLVEMKVTNENGYVTRTDVRMSDGTYYPIPIALNMLCKSCAIEISETIRGIKS